LTNRPKQIEIERNVGNLVGNNGGNRKAAQLVIELSRYFFILQ
jgi:hypothetical protein